MPVPTRQRGHRLISTWPKHAAPGSTLTRLSPDPDRASAESAPPRRSVLRACRREPTSVAYTAVPRAERTRMDSSAVKHAVTAVLSEAGRAGRDVFDDLLPLVYDELRQMARRHLARERRQRTLSTTGLVHEAYLKLVDQTQRPVRSRAYFFAAAARAMRQVLVDAARRRGRRKRGGGQAPLEPRGLRGRGGRLRRRADRPGRGAGAARRALPPPGPRRGVPLLRRAVRRGDGRGPRAGAAHRQARLVARAGLALPGAARGGR